MTNKIIPGDLVEWNCSESPGELALVIARYMYEAPNGYVAEEVALIERKCTVDFWSAKGLADNGGWWIVRSMIPVP